MTGLHNLHDDVTINVRASTATWAGLRLDHRMTCERKFAWGAGIWAKFGWELRFGNPPFFL